MSHEIPVDDIIEELINQLELHGINLRKRLARGEKIYVVSAYIKHYERMTSTYMVLAKNKKDARGDLTVDGEHGVNAVCDIKTYINEHFDMISFDSDAKEAAIELFSPLFDKNAWDFNVGEIESGT